MAGAEQLNQIVVDFENLRVERFDHAKEVFAAAKNVDHLLADIANLTMLLYLNNKSHQLNKEGFKSTSER